MVRIGGSTEKGQHIKEHDYYTPTGEFRIDRGGSQILLNCLMYKMCYYRFGSVYTEQGKLDRCLTISLPQFVSEVKIHDSLLFLMTPNAKSPRLTTSPDLLSSMQPVLL